MDQMKANRVVVTGMGAITPQGATLEDYWDGVRDGRVAIRKVKHLPMDGFRTEIGGRGAGRRPGASTSTSTRTASTTARSTSRCRPPRRR